ncbi:MAG: protein kinase [Deltaproteobacteria bacterium]|nr:protein kinase [Deltaproteobacteria bacterium]
MTRESKDPVELDDCDPAAKTVTDTLADSSKSRESSRAGLSTDDAVLVPDVCLGLREDDRYLKSTLPKKGLTDSVKTSRSRKMLRFLREARVTGQLEHPNITPIYELGRTKSGELYYTMRFISGDTLGKRLAACSGLGERLGLLGAFWNVCNAITYAHSRGVVHRDIKPSNVILGDHGQAVVVDWGVAKIGGGKDDSWVDGKMGMDRLGTSEHATVDGTLVGTPSCMSPEQASGQTEKVDERSDVWALGVMLYQMLVGKRPFVGHNWVDVVDRIIDGRFLSVRLASPEAPAELAAVVKKALQKNPDDRYQNAAEMTEEINAYMTGGRVQAYSYSSWEMFRRFAAKNKKLFVAGGLALASIVIALVVVSFSLRAESHARRSAELAQLQEQEATRIASFHLAYAQADKADKLLREGRSLSAGIYAAASLFSNPAHPMAPGYDAGFGQVNPASKSTLLRSASLLYRISFLPRVGLDKVIELAAVVNAVDVSSDGCRIATGDDDGRITIWDVEKKQKLRFLQASSVPIYSVACSPSEDWIVGGGRDGFVRLWDARSGKLLQEMRGAESSVMAMSFSPDGRTLVTGSRSGVLHVWDLTTGRQLTQISTQGGRTAAVVFSPSGQTIFSGGSDGVIRTWALDGTPGPVREGHFGDILSLRFSPDGEVFASAGKDGKVIVWEPETWKKLRSLDAQQEGVTCLGFSSDGQKIATAGYTNNIMLFDRKTGERQTVLDAHEGFVKELAFSSDGQFLVSASYDRTVKIWRLSAPRPLTRMTGHRAIIHSLDISGDGRFLVTSGWDETARVWDLATGAALHVLRGHKQLVTRVRFAPNSRTVATVGRDQTVRLWDALTGDCLSVWRPEGTGCIDVAFSPDGKLVALAGVDGLIRLLQVKDGRNVAIFRGHGKMVRGVAFSPDGLRLASGACDGLGKIWSISTGQEEISLKGHSDWVSDISFSPDGKRVVTAGKDSLVIVWDARSGKRQLTLRGHRQWVNEVAWSPDGRLLATASDDKTVRVWSSQDGRPLLIINGESEMVDIDFTPDSEYLAVGDDDTAWIYPMDFSYTKRSPAQLLQDAEQRAGAKLDGFELIMQRGEI